MSSTAQHSALKNKAEDEEPCCLTPISGSTYDLPGFIEFFTASGSRYGFALASLCHYGLVSLDPKQLADNGPNAAPQAQQQELTLVFSKAVVSVTGWRLEWAADYLQRNVLIACKTITPPGYDAKTDPRPAITAIHVRFTD